MQAQVATMLEDATGEEQHQYLTFLCSEETFALSILCIKEILEYGGVTTVPMMPECVRGVINLRGRVVPVVDLARRFGRSATAIGRRTCIIIVEVMTEEEQQDIGVIVDAVHQVLDIAPEEIEPAPSFGATIRADLLKGLGKVDGQFVLILDSDKVLAIEELAELAHA